MTNKDKLIERFNNMSAENLMDWLETLDGYCEGCLVDDCRDDETCRESYIRWLKKEWTPDD